MRNILSAMTVMALIIIAALLFASCRSFLPDISLSDLINISETTAQPSPFFIGGDDDDVHPVITPTYIRSLFDDIYKATDSQDAVFATEDELASLFYLTPEDVKEYYLKSSSGKYGVADVYLVKPAAEKQDAVIKALEERRADRIKQFEHFNVHNSYNIVLESKVLVIGDYVALVMIDNAETVTNLLREKLG